MRSMGKRPSVDMQILPSAAEPHNVARTIRGLHDTASRIVNNLANWPLDPRTCHAEGLAHLHGACYRTCTYKQEIKLANRLDWYDC
jgi:hypothetical protein